MVADALIALGLNDDWSFEEQFNALKSVPTWAYDGSVSRKVFLIRLFRALLRFYRPERALYQGRIVLAHLRFFKGNKYHLVKFAGTDKAPNFVSLTTIIRQATLSGCRKIFVKIDVEGWEYMVLDELVAHAGIIEGLAIEFHSVQLNLNRIGDFVRAFPLTLIHTHVNNFSVLDADNVPEAIECSFTAEPTGEDLVTETPHLLDMPNEAESGDYRVNFIRQRRES